MEVDVIEALTKGQGKKMDRGARKEKGKKGKAK